MKAASFSSLTASSSDLVSNGIASFAPKTNGQLVLDAELLPSSSSKVDEDDLDELSTDVLIPEPQQPPKQMYGNTPPSQLDSSIMHQQRPGNFSMLPIFNKTMPKMEHAKNVGKKRSLVSTKTSNTNEPSFTSFAGTNHHRRDLPLLAPLLVSDFLTSSTSDLFNMGISSTDAVTQTLNNTTQDKDLDLDSFLALCKDSATSLGCVLVSDLLYVCIRYGLPQKWLIRELYRHRSRGGLGRFLFREPVSQHNNAFGRSTVMPYRLLGKLTERQRCERIAVALSRKKIHGIKNYGQTCFLNSVLQSLAGLPQFMLYLERIVQLHNEHQQQQQQQQHNLDDEQIEEYSTDMTESLSEFLLQTLLFLNGCDGDKNSNYSSIQPRELLYRIGQKHSQFKSRYGHGRAHVGTEQQDAQEVLQALIDMIITDACLDDTTDSVESSASSRFPLPERRIQHKNNNGKAESSVEDDDDGLNFSLSSLLDQADYGAEQNSSETSVSAFDHHASEKREEKKQEEFEMGDHESRSVEWTKKAKQHKSSKHEIGMQQNQSVDIQGGIQLTPAMNNMLKTISPISPSPLTGWIGSTLQCCKCHHIRPIRNAPFLDIAIVPTSVSRYMSSPTSASQSPASTFPACSLSQCIDDFTSIERVNDVECLNCTIKSELEKLEEEIFMLRGAIDTILSRLRKKGVADGRHEQVKTLKDELNIAEVRKFQLMTMDPDDTEEWESMNKSTAVEDGLLDTDDFLGKTSSTALHRGPAKKCLLLTRLPSVLCFHVQRRYYDPMRDTMCKAMQHVDFPETLDLRYHCAYGGQSSSWVGQTTTSEGSNIQSTSSRRGQGTKPILYRLMSVIEHRGNAHAGHYQAYRRAPDSSSSKEWVLVSDLDVTPLNWQDVQRAQAYMLFYEKI